MSDTNRQVAFALVYSKRGSISATPALIDGQYSVFDEVSEVTGVMSFSNHVIDITKTELIDFVALDAKMKAPLTPLAKQIASTVVSTSKGIAFAKIHEAVAHYNANKPPGDTRITADAQIASYTKNADARLAESHGYNADPKIKASHYQAANEVTVAELLTLPENEKVIYSTFVYLVNPWPSVSNFTGYDGVILGKTINISNQNTNIQLDVSIVAYISDGGANGGGSGGGGGGGGDAAPEVDDNSVLVAMSAGDIDGLTAPIRGVGVLKEKRLVGSGDVIISTEIDSDSIRPVKVYDCMTGATLTGNRPLFVRVNV